MLLCTYLLIPFGSVGGEAKSERTSVWSSWDPLPSWGHQCFQKAKHSGLLSPLLFTGNPCRKPRCYKGLARFCWQWANPEFRIFHHALTDTLFYPYSLNLYFAFTTLFGFRTESIVNWLQCPLASNWGSESPSEPDKFLHLSGVQLEVSVTTSVCTFLFPFRWVGWK